MMMIFRLSLIGALLWPLAATAQDEHPDKHRLALTAGELGLADSISQPGRYGIEYQARSFFSWKLVPVIGFLWAENGASYAYTGLRRDFWLGSRWVLTPTFAIGAFQESDELKLGHELEFRSGIELSWRFRTDGFFDDWRLGAGFYHVSNAGIGETNPGSESAVILLSAPLW